MATPQTRVVNDLAARLLAHLLPGRPGENVFVSPVSIFTGLAAVANGAAGETFEAIAAALGMPGATPDEVNTASQKVLALLEQLDREYAEERRYGVDVELRVQALIANGVWLNHRAKFEPAFVDTLRTAYQTEVAGADFGAAETAEIIDRWVSERTAGKIDAIAGKLDPLVTLLLVNAISFKGGWASVFKPERTTKAPFHLADGRTITCDMMLQNSLFSYAEGDAFQMVVLPFIGSPENRHDGTSMVIVLPRPGHTPAEVHRLLGDSWLELGGDYRRNLREVELSLPRFTIAFDADLSATLKALGMDLAFRLGQADFSNLTRSAPAALSEVRHSTTLVVNEDGAEAAGATAVKMAHFGVPSRLEMRVDRPFLCAIVTGQQWTPLFLGVVSSPERVPGQSAGYPQAADSAYRSHSHGEGSRRAPAPPPPIRQGSAESVYVKLVAVNGTAVDVSLQVGEDWADLVLQDDDLASFGIAAEGGPSRLLGDTASSGACFVRSLDPKEPGTKVFHGNMKLGLRLVRALTETPASLAYDDERGWVLSWELGPASL